MEKFKQKYTIKSTRLENYDYAQNGLYFVTICTKDREELFGEIKDGKMVLNDVGKIVQDEWLKTPIIRPNVFLDAWVIMPNHLHIIVEIINPVETPRWGVLETTHNDAPQLIGEILPIATMEMPIIAKTSQIIEPERLLIDPKTPQRGVSTGKCGGYNPNWKPNSLGSIINQFKSVCTKRIWKLNPITFAWQRNYYDHIIRNDESLNKIREYIIKNPEMWERDRNNTENIWM
jgi:REP element-mobilizing transposase RayT